MDIDGIKRIFQKGVRRYRWGIPLAHAFFLSLGIALLVCSYYIATIDSGIWIVGLLMAIAGISIIYNQIMSVIHREWLDTCRYMLRFLDGKHNKLVWVYFSAGKDAKRAKAGEASSDGLCYTLNFWFANKTCRRVTGRKPVLDLILSFYISRYRDVSYGYSNEFENRFYHDPLGLKTKPAHNLNVNTGDAPLVFRTQRLRKRFLKQIKALDTAAGIALRVFWFCVSFSVSVYFLATFGWNVYMSSSCPGWPTAAGVVTYADSSGEDDLISYEYTVGDKTYHSERLTFDGRPEKHIGDYQEGSNVTVYYEPVFPAQSVLIPGGFDPYNYVYLGLGVLFIGLGWIAYGWGIGKYKTITDPVYWS